MVARVSGLQALAPDFDALLVDVWGVIHDGERPYEGVIDALAALGSAGRRVLLFTNTSRLCDAVLEALGRMGVGRSLFEDVITAGDVSRAALLARDPRVFASIPTRPRVHHVGAIDFVPWLLELGLEFVDDPSIADLVIATGVLESDAAVALAREKLAPAAVRNVPLVCTNPDRVVPSAHGLRLGPGAIAHAYASLGAPVFLYGKPHLPIYEAARARLTGVDPRRILAIGDTPETDILGANRAGYASALVVGTGVKATDFGAAVPEYIVDRFAW